MIRKIVKAPKEDVREQALRLLKESGEPLHATERTRYLVSYAEGATLLDQMRGRGESEEELYSLITNEETKAKVLYFHVPTSTENYYRIVYFAPDEWGRYTFPFKELPEENIYIAVLLNACFVKPVKPLSPDEALTSDFRKELNAYFGTDESEDLDEEEGFTLRDLFIKWATYEFVRTEDYSHLRKCLEEFRKFHLPKEWAEGLTYLHTEPEEFVLGKYLSRDALSILQRDQLREIAEAINAPLPLVIKASKERIWEY